MYLIQYAVRVKGTQCYLPRSQRRDGRGGSHLEPIDFSKPPNERGIKSTYAKNMMIRTFTTRGAAANLLTMWLNGKYYGDEDGDTWNKHVPERKRENMEIVELRLELPQP
jgi:hypothetical protein